MVHFRLKQETDEIDGFVPVEFEGFGEETVDILCDRVYPDYFDASITECENWPDEEEATKEDVTAVLRNLNAALVKERTRQWGAKEPEISDDTEAAHLQKSGLDLPKTVAERTAKEHRHRQFLEARQSRTRCNELDTRLASASLMASGNTENRHALSGMSFNYAALPETIFTSTELEIRWVLLLHDVLQVRVLAKVRTLLTFVDVAGRTQQHPSSTRRTRLKLRSLPVCRPINHSIPPASRATHI